MAAKQLKLNGCSVSFDKDSHTYTYNGKTLSGVTSMLERNVFPGKYEGVPKDVLAKAASRGSDIHNEIEEYIKGGVAPSTPEAQTFVSLGLDMIASEYLVSDLTHTATFIDAVEKVRGGVVLWDFKTNRGGADRMYLQWQLSVNAYLFNLVNPDIKVKGIKGLWLCDDRYEIISFDRTIPESEVRNLIEADSMGLPYSNPYAEALTETDTRIAGLLDVERKLVELEVTVNALKTLRTQALSQIKEVLERQNEDGGGRTFEGEHIRLTLIEDKETDKTVFDEERFKADNPELYSMYTKTKHVTTKGYVKVTLRKNSDGTPAVLGR